MKGVDLLKVNNKMPGAQLSKSEKTKLMIIEKAIDLTCAIGWEKATFTRLARELGVSRPLLTHYFPQKTDLFSKCITFVNIYAEEFTSINYQEHSTATKQLGSYVDVNYKWMKHRPNHFKFWMFFLYHCTFNKKWMKLNSSIKHSAREKIKRIIKTGVLKKEFEISDISLTAEAIHHTIYSRILSFFTEENNLNIQKECQRTKDICLRYLRKKY